MQPLFGYDFIRQSDRAWVARWFTSSEARDNALKIVRENFDRKAGRMENRTMDEVRKRQFFIELDSMDDGYAISTLE